MSNAEDSKLMENIKAAAPVEPTFYPEHELLAGIVQRAVWDAFGSFREGKNQNQKTRKMCALEAQRWLWSEENHPFSYVWICEHLSIAPDELLRKLEKRLLSGAVAKELKYPLTYSSVVKDRLAIMKQKIAEGRSEDDDLKNTSQLDDLFLDDEEEVDSKAVWPDD